jgi:hypothetical protein
MASNMIATINATMVKLINKMASKVKIFVMISTINVQKKIILFKASL